jgi:hypothetical protein
MRDLRTYFLKRDRWPSRVVPISDDEMDKAVETLRFCYGLSTTMPHRALKKLLEPFFASGWCLGAVEYALKWRPNGIRQPVFQDSSRGWQVERQLVKWLTRDGQPHDPPREAQTREAAYLNEQELLERDRRRHESEIASPALRESVVDEARLQERERQHRARHDRVAAAREKDRRVRATLGDLARMAGMHESENVHEIPLPQFRSEGERRQQTSQLIGSARTGYLESTERFQERIATEGTGALTSEMRRVMALRTRDTKSEASLAYLELLIDETRDVG